jgi:integrase
MAASTMLSATGGILDKKAGSGKSARMRLAQPPIKCPECSSQKIWKDGLRYIKSEIGTIAVQRYICRSCGRRFSETDPAPPSPRRRELSQRRKKNVDLFGSYLKPNTTHYKANGLTLSRQVCVTETQGAKNLVKVETRQKRAAGATTKLNEADMKGKIFEYAWWMKKQGYRESTIMLGTRLMKRLVKLGANILDPESVKETIAKQDTWNENTKLTVVNIYTAFLKMIGQTWIPPIYKEKRKLPFIPTEREIDQLIASCGKKTATFLQTLKETAMRSGEALNLEWIDVDIDRKVIRVTPEKNSNPRIFKVSNKLIAMLNNLPRKSRRVFTTTLGSIRGTFYYSRRLAADKLQNPRILEIHFHTLRHWKATMLYHQTKDILHVMNYLGHKSIKNTLLYVQLSKVLFEDMPDEFTTRVTKSVKGARVLLEAGFDFVLEMDGVKIFRKRK